MIEIIRTIEENSFNEFISSRSMQSAPKWALVAYKNEWRPVLSSIDIEALCMHWILCPLFSLHSRLTLACGGMQMNSFDDLTADCLGHAGLVYEHVLVSWYVHVIHTIIELPSLRVSFIFTDFVAQLVVSFVAPFFSVFSLYFHTKVH